MQSSKPADSWNRLYLKIGIFIGLVIAVAIVYATFRPYLTLDYLAARESELKEYQAANPLLVYGVAFLIYVAVTGFSLPGATIMTLVVGWYFQLWPGLIFVSFAATAGATLAFLMSRYLFRDLIQKRFAARLTTFNEALDREGAFYLFTLRLIPAVPFFIINVVMGLTRIRTWTFWWVSQIGMLPGTTVYVYAGSRIPDLRTLEQEGAGAVFTPTQLTEITIALVLLGVFPICAKKILERVKGEGKGGAASSPDHGS